MWHELATAGKTGPVILIFQNKTTNPSPNWMCCAAAQSRNVLVKHPTNELIPMLQDLLNVALFEARVGFQLASKS